MSLFGKFLAVLNLVALLAFLFMASAAYKMRQAWSYSVLRWDMALDGMPIDEADLDQQGRPKYLNLDDKLCELLTGDATIATQQAYLDLRKKELIDRLAEQKIKVTPLAKLDT